MSLSKQSESAKEEALFCRSANISGNRKQLAEDHTRGSSSGGRTGGANPLITLFAIQHMQVQPKQPLPSDAEKHILQQQQGQFLIPSITTQHAPLLEAVLKRGVSFAGTFLRVAEVQQCSCPNCWEAKSCSHSCLLLLVAFAPHPTPHPRQYHNLLFWLVCF